MQHFLRHLLSVSFFASAIHSLAQVEINYPANAPRESDTIVRCEAVYFPAGPGGEDVLWDFSGDISTTDIHRVYYTSDSLGNLLCMEPSRMLKYRLTGDSLMQTGYETRLRSMAYTPSICVTVFPSGFGDTHSSSFRGSGLYCQRMSIETEGTSSVEVDASGSICLSEGDTLRNALRLHYLKTGSVWMHEPGDTTVTAPSRRRQEIEERYLWYVRGYRYPVLETVTVTFYDNLSLVSERQEAYLSLPDWQQCLNDSVNMEIQAADSLAHAQQTMPPNMEYTIQLDSSGRLRFNYSVTATSNITFLICNATGITYVSASTRKEAGSGYTADFDCSGLLHGTYLLYINCNGQVYSETFQK